ncbi:MAG: IS66 family insertion sequence element accessory protein TnpA [Alphaproteobacteria bacterium]
MSLSTHGTTAVGEDRTVFWRTHVDAWRKSGLSARRYCEKHGLNRGTLGYWSSRLRAAATAEPPWFLPAQAAAVAEEPAVGDAGVALELAEGISIRVARGFDAETLARVLAVVRP